MSNDEIEELKEQTQKGSRVTAAAAESESSDRKEVLTEEYTAVRSGDASKTVSFRDEFAAGLLHSTQVDDALSEDLAAALQQYLSENTDPAEDRSELIRQVVRVGLQEASPDIFDDAKEAYARSVAEDI